METYKQQVDDLNKRLSELQVENESLENRNRLLEKVVQIKDQKPAAVAESTPVVRHPKSSCRMRFHHCKSLTDAKRQTAF